MKKNLTTQVGQTEDNAQSSDAHVNAINQVFAILRRNYHNQYYKALPDEKELSITKRLWFESLQRFEANTILKAAKSVIESSEYLPTLRTMIRHCEEVSDLGLPEAHNAYIEACRAPSPKANQEWSHPAVYYAGKNCDWYFLQSSNEEIAFPIFKKIYEKICQQVLQGTVLPEPKRIAIEENIEEKLLDKNSNLKHLHNLKQSLDL